MNTETQQETCTAEGCTQPALLRPPYDYCGSPLCAACLHEESWQDELAQMRAEDARQWEEAKTVLRGLSYVAFIVAWFALGYILTYRLGWAPALAIGLIVCGVLTVVKRRKRPPKHP